MTLAVLRNFALPIFICGAGFILIKFATFRIGFELDVAYSATANSLRAWLATKAGEFPPPAEDLKQDLQDTFSSGVNTARVVFEADSESYLQSAARAVAQQSPEAIVLVSHEMKRSVLKLDSSGRYRLILNK